MLKVVCIGAGPAGLTAAYLLSKAKVPVTVLEADPVYVGGISKTTVYKGFHFDVGGHRFFSKSKEIENLWTELLPDDWLVKRRKSRIYYRGKFYSYPLKPFEAMGRLGAKETLSCGLSYLKAKSFPVRSPGNFEDWVSNQFGRRLYRTFFKTYTEKVWGMDCKDISSDWAAQRIKGLSVRTALLHSLKGSSEVKSLSETFRYPRRGPGMLWQSAAEKVARLGGEVRLGCRVTDLRKVPGGWEIAFEGPGGKETLLAEHVISSAPLGQMIQAIEPLPLSANLAAKLRYRDFLSVGLIVKERRRFDDNWIYVHEPSVRVGRIQNFKAWSDEMIPEGDRTCYGMEYFCFENDDLWGRPDKELIEFAGNELVKLGLAESGDVLDGCVLRQKKAYPVYDEGYAGIVERVRLDMESNYPGFHFVGRNGMHKYDNQDHAMMTAILTARNILAGGKVYDVWSVNQDAEYHETSAATSGLRFVPSRASQRSISSTL